MILIHKNDDQKSFRRVNFIFEYDHNKNQPNECEILQKKIRRLI